MAEPSAFYSVEEDGPVPLRLPPSVRDWSGVYDALRLGVYSRLRSYPGARFFGLAEHLARTELSRRLLGIPHALDEMAVRRAIQEVTEAYPEESTLVRFDLLSSPAEAFGSESLLIVSVAPFVPVPAEFKARGVGVVFSDLVRRNPRAKRAAFVRERGGYATGGRKAYERLLLGSEGEILEGSSSNFFAIVDGVLRTTRDGVLQGVTQRFCLRLAEEAGLPTEERPVRMEELPGLEEAFLTSSSRGIVPIVSIEGQAVGDGEPGHRTRALASAYDTLAERDARVAWPL